MKIYLAVFSLILDKIHKNKNFHWNLKQIDTIKYRAVVNALTWCLMQDEVS